MSADVIGEAGRQVPSGRPAVLRASEVWKHYGGVTALSGANLEVHAGTIHAVVGENGAGKSSLMKILAGASMPDAGSLFVDEVQTILHDSRAAARAGIGIVYQELSLFPDRSVAANLLPTDQPTHRGLVSTRRMRELATPVLERVGAQVSPDAIVRSLTLAERQLVEIARALLQNPRILIMDEPNSALGMVETSRLFAILRSLVTQGMAVIYVSHRLEEVFDISTRVTVVRDGKDVLTADRSSLTVRDVVRAMIGHDPTSTAVPATASSSAQLGRGLTVKGLSAAGIQDVSFTASPGEIVGVAGLEGAGARTLLETLFGLHHVIDGSAEYPDGAGIPDHPRVAARRQIAFVPADRRHHGLMLQRSVAANLGHVAIGAGRGSPWVRRSQLVGIFRRQESTLRIKADSPWMSAFQLSGGNQQKIVLGKWLEVQPELFLLDDPTRGIDVGAKDEIHSVIRSLASGGRVVLMTSSDLTELLGLADRIIVFYRGRLIGDIHPGSSNAAGLLHAVNTGDLS